MITLTSCLQWKHTDYLRKHPLHKKVSADKAVELLRKKFPDLKNLPILDPYRFSARLYLSKVYFSVSRIKSRIFLNILEKSLSDQKKGSMMSFDAFCTYVKKYFFITYKKTNSYLKLFRFYKNRFRSFGLSRNQIVEVMKRFKEKNVSLEKISRYIDKLPRKTPKCKSYVLASCLFGKRAEKPYMLNVKERKALKKWHIEEMGNGTLTLGQVHTKLLEMTKRSLLKLNLIKECNLLGIEIQMSSSESTYFCIGQTLKNMLPMIRLYTQENPKFTTTMLINHILANSTLNKGSISRGALHGYLRRHGLPCSAEQSARKLTDAEESNLKMHFKTARLPGNKIPAVDVYQYIHDTLRIDTKSSCIYDICKRLGINVRFTSGTLKTMIPRYEASIFNKFPNGAKFGEFHLYMLEHHKLFLSNSTCQRLMKATCGIITQKYRVNQGNQKKIKEKAKQLLESNKISYLSSQEFTAIVRTVTGHIYSRQSMYNLARSLGLTVRSSLFK